MGRSLTHQQANWTPVAADDGTIVWGGVVRHDEIDRNGVQHAGARRYMLNVGDRSVELDLQDALALAFSVVSDITKATASSVKSVQGRVPRPRRH